MNEKENDIKIGNDENKHEEEKEKEKGDTPKNDIIIVKKKENKRNEEKKQKINREIGPRMKKCKREHKEDRELQIACEDPEERKERIKEEKIEAKIKKQKQKEEELKRKNVIYLIDEENYKCADCDKEKTTYISINNGITLCDFCAKLHISLGNSISYIRNINDQLDEYLFNYIVFGSNTKFKRFILNENLEQNLMPKKKYKTKCLSYYRKMLKSKVKGIIPPEKNYENPNEIDKDTNDYYPEFKKYKIEKQIIINCAFKGESKFGYIFNKLMNIKNNLGNKKNTIMLLRTRSSVDELKGDIFNTDEDDDSSTKKKRLKKLQSNNKPNDDIKIVPTTTRPLNTQGKDNNKDIDKKIEGDQEVQTIEQQTTEEIINKEK